MALTLFRFAVFADGVYLGEVQAHTHEQAEALARVKLTIGPKETVAVRAII